MEQWAILRLTALLGLVAAGPGCSLVLQTPVVVDGRSFRVDAVPELRVGMTAEAVEALIGTPLVRASRGEGDVWTYHVQRKLRACRLYLGSIPLQPPPTAKYSLEITFRDRILVRAIYRDQDPDRTIQRTVVEGGR